MGHTDRTAPSETSDQSRYVIRAGELAHDSYELDLTPERAGWEWSSLRVVALAPGKPLTVPAGEHEYLVLPLSGGCTVQAGGESLEVAGRESVFTDITDYVVPVEFVEVDANLVYSVIQDVDLAVINGNYALDSGLTADDAIYKESEYADNSYYCLIAVRSEDAENPVYKRIVEAYQTQDTIDIYNNEFKGFFVPAWTLG